MKHSTLLNDLISFMADKLDNDCKYYSYIIEIKTGSPYDDMIKNIVCFNQIVNRFNQYHVTYKLNLLTSRKELRFDKR